MSKKKIWIKTPADLFDKITTIPLTKKQIRAWIKELRSGNYRQGACWLCREDDEGFTHCCLGVLPEALEVGEWVRGRNEVGKWVWKYRHPEGKRPRVGLLPARMLPVKIQDFLSYQNDNTLATFEGIADWIERELLPRASDA